MDPINSLSSRVCVAFVMVAGATLFSLVGCGSSSKLARVDAAADIGTPGIDAAGDMAAIDAAVCPASCDDGNDCTTDSCDPSTHQCVHTPVADGTSCQGKPCTTNSVCQAGLCLDGPFKKCTASDQCHAVGTCSPATGECENPNVANGTKCDDGNKCTYGDQCNAGLCAGTPLVCGGTGTCDADAGTCPNGFPTALAAWSFDNATWPTNGSGLITSPDGEIFAAGAYFNQIDLGSGPIVADPTDGQTDIFLAKLDPSTTKATWSVAFPGPQNQYVTSFAVDGAGHLGVVGPLQGAITVAGNEVDALYVGDQYIFGASALDGTGRWARRLNLQSGKADPAKRPVGLRAIAGDPQGSSFMVCGTVACATGSNRGDAGPNPDPAKDLSPSLLCQGGTDLVVARIDSSDSDAGTNSGNGAIVWADEVGGTNDEYCGTLAMDAQSNTYVVGTYRFGSEVTFGTTTLPMVGQAGTTAWMYLAKLDPHNSWVWAQGYGTGNQAITPTSMIALDSDVLVAGTIGTGPLSFQGVAVDSPTFIARFQGSTGNLGWIEGLGNGGNLTITSMTESGGHILVSGSYDTACTLGAIPLPAPSLGGGGFVAELDGSDGAVFAAKGFVDPKDPSNADAVVNTAGIVGLSGAGGTAQDGSLLLLTYTSKLDLGPPIGVLQTEVQATSGGVSGTVGSVTTVGSCLATLGP
jgi:hypothetical protein